MFYSDNKKNKYYYNLLLSTARLLFAVSILQLQPSVEQQTNLDPPLPEMKTLKQFFFSKNNIYI